MMILPSLYDFNMSHISLLAVVSMPDDGSSRKTSLDPPMRAIPSCNFHFWPPESDLTLWFLFFQSFKSQRSCQISLFLPVKGAPLKSENRLKCSQGVKRGKRMLCWGQTPIIFQSLPVFLKTSTPITWALPFDFPSIPERQLIVVVLPAPLCPRRANIYPAYMLMFKFSTATKEPKVFLKPLISKNLFSSSSLNKFSSIFSNLSLSYLSSFSEWWWSSFLWTNKLGNQ